MIKDRCVNHMIKARQVKLIDAAGTFLGEVSFASAIEMAQNEDLDLVEIDASSNGDIPVCKIMDYGKLKYQEAKKNKQNNKQDITKDMRFSLNISEHDLKVKHIKINEFLSKKFKVKYTIRLKGREINMMEIAKNKLKSNLSEFDGRATWGEFSCFGKELSVILNPC